MECKCKKYWQAGLPCPTGQPVSALTDASAQATTAQEHTSPRGIVFGVDPQAHGTRGGVPIPGYDAPGLALKPPRDPSLSLIALSGIDPSGPLMAEVPPVMNNSPFTRTQVLVGWRIGFANRYVGPGASEAVDHSPAFLQALDTLRSAGAQLVALDALRGDRANPFVAYTRNEIDERVGEHSLDALVSESKSAAFHGACASGYPGACELLEDGTKLWFYGARWAGDRILVLVRFYRRLLKDSLRMPTSSSE